MKLGLAIGYSGAHLDVPVALVQRAEELGYDSVWSAEAYGSDFASACTDRSIFLYRLRKFTNAFAEFAQPKRLQRARHPIRSSPPQAAPANSIGNTEAGERQPRKNPVAAPTG